MTEPQASEKALLPPPAWPSDRPAAADSQPVARRRGALTWPTEAPLTQAIIALNTAIFLVEASLSQSLSEFPSRLALQLGACYGLATIGELRFETLVTACFLHAGLVHLAFNMIALWQAGPLLERAVGAARMAPMYLFAGAFGNGLSVAVGWWTRSGSYSVGASGAVCGVIGATMVLAWRTQGFRAPLTQAMARWLGFVLLFGLLSTRVRVDNLAHAGGALAGGAIALTWRRGPAPSPGATAAVVSACAALLVACIGVVSFRNRTDFFSPMLLIERSEFTRDALQDGRCDDALAGLRAVERLRASMAPVRLRAMFQETCGAIESR